MVEFDCEWNYKSVFYTQTVLTRYDVIWYSN